MNITRRIEIAEFCESLTHYELIELCKKLISENEELIAENEELKKLDELVTLEQLKEFAMEKGIDVEGLTTRKSVRNAIKSALTAQTE